MAITTNGKNIETRTTGSTPQVFKYTAFADGESIAVSSFPSVGGKYNLTMTGDHDDDKIYYIQTKISKFSGVARRTAKTIVFAISRTGSQITRFNSVRLQTEEERIAHGELINKFIAGIGKVPKESDIKTEDDFKKFFIYHLCDQAATMGKGSSTDTEESKGSLITTATTTVDNSVVIGDYPRNIPPRYKWTKKGVRELVVEEKTEATDHSLVSLRDKIRILKGEMQSGKTLWMITRSLMEVYIGKTSVVILRELNGDHLQILRRIGQVNEDYVTQAKKRFGLDLTNIIDVVENVHKFSTTSKDEIIKVFNGETPKFIACISNASPMNKLIDCIRLVNRPQYSLFIDEADYVDSGDSSQMLTLKSRAMEILKRFAYRITMVSATVIENIMYNDVNPENYFYLRPGQYYRSVRAFTFRSCTRPIQFSDKKNADFFVNDPGLGRHMKKLSESKPFTDSTWRSMPPIHLFNLGSAIEAQELAQTNLMKRHPGICSIVYNGDGITFYHPDFVNTTIKVGKTTMTKDGPLHKGSVMMSDMLAFCQTGGVVQFPSIAIFSGKLAGRGISYVSGLMRNCRGWHVSSLRLARSKSMNNAALLQAIGRLCGNFDTNVPLTLYVDDETCDAAWNAYLQQENILSKAYNTAMDSGDMMKNAITSLPLSIKQRGDRNISTTVKRTVFSNIVPDEKADKWEELEVVERPKKKRKVEVVEESKDENFNGYSAKVIAESRKEVGEDEYTTLTTSRFPKWSKGNSKISTFMNNLDPLFVYSADNIKTFLPVSDVVNSVKDKHRGNGRIMKKTKDGYILHPCLYKAFVSKF